MVRPDQDRLGGEVEVDVTYVRGIQAGVSCRYFGNTALLAISAQVGGQANGRVRMCRIPDASYKALLTFVKMAVEPGAVVSMRDGGLKEME